MEDLRDLLLGPLAVVLVVALLAVCVYIFYPLAILFAAVAGLYTVFARKEL